MPNFLKRLVPDKAQGFTPLASALQAFSPYWMIERNYAESALRALQNIDFAAHAQEYSASLMDDGDGGDTDDPFDLDGSGVATIRIDGALLKHPTSWGRNTSYITLRRSIRLAASDERVKAIALMIDSPGGSADGVFDCADDIFAVRGQKPIGAYIDGCGCSAAYLLASQCDFVWLGRGAVTANCGSVSSLTDSSAQAKMLGLDVIVIKSTPLKGIGTPGAEITDDQIAEMQRIVNNFNSLFRADVQRGRNLSAEALDNLFDARCRIGADAVAVGAADKVATIDQFYAKLGYPDGGDDEISDESQETDDSLPCDDDDVDTASAVTRHAAPEDSGEREKTPMRDKIAAALRAVGLKSQADAVMGAPDDNEDSIAASLAAQAVADAQVKPMQAATLGTTAPGIVNQRSANERDILTACTASGIATSAELHERLEMAQLGSEYADEIRETAKAEAVRAFGSKLGMQMQSQCENMPIRIVREMSAGWTAEADAKFGIGNKTVDKKAKDGSAAKRASAPEPQMHAVNAESDEGETPKTAFEQLSASMQAECVKMAGNDETKREAIAKQFIATKSTMEAK